MRHLIAILLAITTVLTQISSVEAARRKYGKPAKRTAPSVVGSASQRNEVSGSGQTTSVIQDPEGARLANAAALKLAQSGKLEESMPLFIKAMEMHDGNSEYINNVGVTEMRLGRLESALSRFEIALKMDPTNDAAEANIKDLRAYLKKDQAEEAANMQQARVMEVRTS
jgi:tetratricopeptide (TPR) repeat protein